MKLHRMRWHPPIAVAITVFFVSAVIVSLGLVGWSSRNAAASEAVSASPSRPHVIVVGTPELRWDAVGQARTPTLWRLAAASSLGSLSVKAADSVSCTNDGWLTLGAGNRADDEDRLGDVCAPTPILTKSGAWLRITGFVDPLYFDNVRRPDRTHIGALGDAVRATGDCISAGGTPAALGASDHNGRVYSYRADASAAAKDQKFLTRCGVTLLAATPSTVDALVASVLRAAPPSSVVLVLGLSETGAEPAHLHAALAHGGGYDTGSLVSASTGRTPFVQLVDVAPTILTLRGIPVPSTMIGQPWQQQGRGNGDVARRVEALAQLDTRAQAQEHAIVPFYLTLVGFMLVTCTFGWYVGRRRRPGPAEHKAQVRALRWGRPVSIACAGAALLPAASFLAGLFPWWRNADATLILVIVTGAIDVVATFVVVAAARIAGRGSAVAVPAAAGIFTAAVIGIDLVTGARLEIFTMAGYSPLVAGRFAGIGNVGFGVFAAGAVLAAAGAAARVRRPWLAVAVVAGLAVLVDGLPAFGSDVGGVLALVPAFAVLAWSAAGIALSRWRVVIVVACTAGVVALIALTDYARPASRQTHLGRFVGELVHGGAWGVVRRKALADYDLLRHSVLTLLIPLLVLVGVYLLQRPGPTLRRAFRRVPLMRPTFVALLVVVTVGALVNDSGVAIPALAVLVVLPAAMTVLIAIATPDPAKAPTPEAQLLP